MSKADFGERKSKLKRVLESALGAAAAPYLIQGSGRNPMRYRLPLPSRAIAFSEARPDPGALPWHDATPGRGSDDGQ